MSAAVKSDGAWVPDERYDAVKPLDRLVSVARCFRNLPESFTDRFTVAQLLTLHRSWLCSDWDIPPSKWTERQLAEGLEGIAPNWDAEERPVYRDQ